MDNTFMKEKPVLPLLLSMALPMVISMLVNSLYNIVDSLFVAKISDSAMTALSLVFPVQNFINAAGIGFGVGINAVIAFYSGAGDKERADRARYARSASCRDPRSYTHRCQHSDNAAVPRSFHQRPGGNTARTSVL